MGQISVEEQGQEADDQEEGQVKSFGSFRTLHTAQLRGKALVIISMGKFVQAMADRDTYKP